jgi:hypothetical protein
MWQYANMAIVQSGYIRRVANENVPLNRIRELREERGMTQADLARLANVTPSALNKIESGSRGLDQNWMRRLAPLLQVAPADLLPPEDNPFRLSAEEQALIERYRSADTAAQATFEKVVDAVLPYQGLPSERAA